jgi:hypothetical protein
MHLSGERAVQQQERGRRGGVQLGGEGQVVSTQQLVVHRLAGQEACNIRHVLATHKLVNQALLII